MSLYPSLCAAVAAVLIASCGGPSVDNGVLVADVHNGVADEVTVQGAVTAVLPDSNGGDGPHQNFDIDVSGVRVQVIHNLSLAARVPVGIGDTVVVHGQFEPDPGHPVIHYTHHSTDRHEGGYIVLKGTTYQ